VATLITKTPACDEGLARCDNSTLLRVQLVIDGRRSTQLLCVKHAAPFVRLQEKMGVGKAARPRGKVYTAEEIAQKRAAAKKR
jgi:hypothetical protein